MFMHVFEVKDKRSDYPFFLNKITSKSGVKFKGVVIPETRSNN